MNDLLDEEDTSDDSVTVHVLESGAARERYLDEQRRRSPAAFRPLEW
jgi:hypothetical protein